MSLDEKKLRKRMFESELKIIYYMKRPNGMNYMHDKKVNKRAELNLLHDMLKPSKRTKNINSHYSPIIHVCMNTQKVKSRFNIFRILLES